MAYIQALPDRHYLTNHKEFNITEEQRLNENDIEARFAVASRNGRRTGSTDWIKLDSKYIAQVNNSISVIKALLQQFPTLKQRPELFPLLEDSYNYRKHGMVCSAYVLKNNIEVKQYMLISETIRKFNAARKRHNSLVLFQNDGTMVKAETSDVLAIVQE